MIDPTAVLDEAAQKWLDWYDARRKFIAATRKLFCTFAASWHCRRCGLMEALDRTSLQDCGLLIVFCQDCITMARGVVDDLIFQFCYIIVTKRRNPIHIVIT
jgi:late competence protein required for DNA uptake (superfamily II DNA/RNA helicase)